MDADENVVRPDFSEYFQKACKPSNNGRCNAALSFFYNDTNNLRLAEAQMVLDHFETRRFDPIASERFHGIRCLEFIGCIERLALHEKMRPLLSMYGTLLDRTVGLAWTQSSAEGGKEDDWYQAHKDTIAMFSSLEDWRAVMAHAGSWKPHETRSLLNICKTFSGNLLYGDWQFDAVTDYMDTVSAGHLDNLLKENTVVRKFHFAQKWELVEKEAKDREILEIFEQHRISGCSWYISSFGQNAFCFGRGIWGVETAIASLARFRSFCLLAYTRMFVCSDV